MRRRPVGRERPEERLATRRRARERRVIRRLSVIARACAGPYAGVVATAVAASIGAAGVANAQEPLGFEQVTPVHKGGGAVHAIKAFQTSDDGSRFLYSTTAPLDGAPADGAPAYVRYVATRGSDSWVSRSLEPPFEIGPGSGSPSFFYFQSVLATSQNQRFAAISSRRALAPGANEDGDNLYLRDADTGGLTLVATSSDPAFVGNTGSTDEISGFVQYVSDDGDEVSFFGNNSASPLPDAPSSGTSIYTWTRSSGLEISSVLPDGTAVAGAPSNGKEPGFTRQATPRADGLRRVYFQMTGGASAAYVRENGVTRLVSYSRVTGASPTAPVNARPQAVTSSGRFALLLANGRLTDDTPVGFTSRVLYRYSAESDSLDYIGAMNASNDAIIEMSDDGRTVAFQSGRALLPSATAGRKNLYVWRDGTLRHVATADAGSTATNNADFLRVLSRNGQYLMFTDSSFSVAQSLGFDNRSTACGTGGAVGPCEQVYRYDVEADHLDCASCRTDGQAPGGASGDPGTTSTGKILLNGHQAQMVANDGTVFFTSDDDLAASDVNGARDVYAWGSSGPRLISRARLGVNSRFLDATPDGQSVFISTDDRLTPTDVDDAVDIYVARPGAGFPVEVPPVIAPCTGSDCRATTNVPAPAIAVPGSVILSPQAPAYGRGKDDKKVSVRIRKADLVGRTKVRFSVRTSDQGRIRISGKR